jgi:hypothetical protein
MSRHILYAYVDGSDLDEIADILDARFEEFIENRHWTAGAASVVNQGREPDPTMQPGDLPDWDLGLNLELPDPGNEPPGWFADVESIARFLGTLHREYHRDFVIGIADSETGITDDLFTVSTHFPDLDELGAIIGVRGERKNTGG